MVVKKRLSSPKNLFAKESTLIGSLQTSTAGGEGGAKVFDKGRIKIKENINKMFLLHHGCINFFPGVFREEKIWVKKSENKTHLSNCLKSTYQKFVLKSISFFSSFNI